MKYFKKAGIYKASNVTFDPTKVDARSYSWWSFVACIGGKIIFNNYYYSPSTRKHQSKVRSLLDQLGITIDLTLPVPRGLQVYDNLDEVIVAAEEHLCDEFLRGELKRQERNLKAAYRRHAKRLTEHLENQVQFRDYEIRERRQFGHINVVAVHQVVELDSMENDVENALHNFHRDGFGQVYFYI